MEPVDRQRGQLFERGALWRQKPAIADRLDAHMRHRAAQLEHMIGVEIGFAIVEFVAQIGNLGVKLFGDRGRSEEHTSELQSLMRISYAVFCLKKKNKHTLTVHVVYINRAYTYRIRRDDLLRTSNN